jgi:CubicO group peptidase (beta-lactamase class C family)
VNKRNFLVSSGAFAAAIGLAQAQTAGIESGTKSRAAKLPRIDALDAYLSRLVQPNEPGLLSLVLRRGEVVHFNGYGYADVERKMLFSENTAVHIGSTGKQFTAIALLLLSQMGHVDLDAPVGRYLAEFANVHPGVTARRLLNHTSGLNTYYPDEDELQQGWKMLLALVEREGSATPSGSQAARVLAELPLRFEPGSRWEYSNTAFELAGTLIERVSRQSYQRFVEQHVFKPLGMHGAFALPNAFRQTASNVAKSYEAVDGRAVRRLALLDRDRLELRLLDGLSGAGTFYMTASDIIQYEAALRAYLPLLRPASAIQMVRPVGAARNEMYGLGLWVGFPFVSDKKLRSRLRRLGPDVMTHSGQWPAFNTEYARFVSADLTIFLALNRDYLLDDVAVLYNLPREQVDQLSPDIQSQAPSRMLVDVAQLALRT